MINKKTVTVVSNNHDATSTLGTILTYSDASPYTINISLDDLGDVEVVADDLFEAIKTLIEKLLDKDIQLLCQGSIANIYSSPGLRQTSAGLSAYLLRTGVPARIEDIVNIFDPIDLDKLVTETSQSPTYEKWLDSLDPTKEEVEEAKNNPGGWVYRIDGFFSTDDAIPPEAIIGSWKVDNEGELTNHFETNPNYNPTDII